MGVPSRPSSASSSLHPDGPNGGDGAFDAPPAYSNQGIGTIYPYRRWRSLDPRTSSTQSLAPSLGEEEQRRTLLLIYIHGFMGNDSSFRSFPAHIHSYLKEALAETHVIHTKIYPRYKTYKAIDVARDNFSLWLEPHEAPTTDVVLIGHSMGGLLAADVALQQTPNHPYGESPFRHRILGTISLDAPLLGLHPGIVVSGIASLFRPAATPQAVTQGDGRNDSFFNQQSVSSLTPDPSIYSEVAPPSGTSSPVPLTPSSSQSPSASDPLYNPPFFNDVSFVDRGWFRNIAHFAKKHKEENIVGAAAHHIMSHLEFGSCLADYPGLRSRYNRVRKLEDVDDLSPSVGAERPVRIRFVNYFTISTGPLEKPKSELPTELLRPGPPPVQQLPGGSSERRSLDKHRESGASTPRISIEDYSDSSSQPAFLEEIEPMPELDDVDEPTPIAPPHNNDTPQLSTITDGIADSSTPTLESSSKEGSDDIADLQLPPIPDLPPPPQAPDLASYPDKDSRKQAEKEAKRVQKIYDQAVKNRDKAIKERQKLIEKRRRKTLKDVEKQAKSDNKKAAEEEKKKTTTKTAAGEEEQRELKLHEKMEKVRLETEVKEQKANEKSNKKEEKDKDKKGKEKKKERKFCMLPGKVNGMRDKTWVQVYMEGVDEVGAHCGLFFPGPHYEKLVGDVGSRIVGWVQEDCSRRAIFDLD
ncbi:hypothetical protein B0H66DRAFT_472660 [Apodospora peruviana]|uniref:DUF676 domain-containing protein n=1 Tax=Apodospora peruviana TaxID=516989 RepID=A0AAE0IKE7_9PEZI|nr:hypothetical protein B0H66DRAFT_472660 [Apodospora peruviana]